ncbi:Os01g0603700 [Oryza sativa Japonica Group]|uniref:Os01g0603700 protein n=1 Tax=Oryza sativa subsp. japonica TaxID=39947 RepID=Q0JLF8_ORYSJ|nr:hypothetical protein OsJ_02515 [Oryza sativa Japonica Group]BAF05420.1 Os01g0603700 [Oryza sativa Japonica Group]|eukprot:NP_001043506.1 Os01g0603700 [Oryza sativa Japonica Group]
MFGRDSSNMSVLQTAICVNINFSYSESPSVARQRKFLRLSLFYFDNGRVNSRVCNCLPVNEVPFYSWLCDCRHTIPAKQRCGFDTIIVPGAWSIWKERNG